MENRNKIFTIILIFFVINLSLAIFCILPIYNGIIKDSEYLISSKNEIATVRAHVLEIGNLEKKYNEYKPNLDKIDQLFVDPKNPVDFIKFLENIASNNNVVSQVSLAKDSQDSGQGEQGFINFYISSKGSFSSIVNFIKKIEEGEYLVEFNRLTIQNSIESSQNADKNLDKNIFNNYPSRTVEALFSIKVFTQN